MVSVLSEKDMVEIKFMNTHQFMIDSYGESSKILPSGYIILVELPPQKVNDLILSEITPQ